MLGARSFSIVDATGIYPGTHEKIALTGSIDAVAVEIVFTQ